MSASTHFTKAIQAEVWEDIEEALEHYKEFLQVFRTKLRSIQQRKELERAIKVIVLVETRCVGLRNDFGTCIVEAKDIKRLKSSIEQQNRGFTDVVIGDQDNVLFPPALFIEQDLRLTELYAELCESVTAEDERKRKEEASLRVQRMLTVCVERVGEKRIADLFDSKGNARPVYYERPFVRVHLYDLQGNVVETARETKGGARQRDRPQHIMFMEDVKFETEYSICRANDHVLFFEFISRNRNKGRDEPICWACLEMNEVPQDGSPLLLEWYKKPIDVYRKKFKLHTRKELYCHVVVLPPDA